MKILPRIEKLESEIRFKKGIPLLLVRRDTTGNYLAKGETFTTEKQLDAFCAEHQVGVRIHLWRD